MDVFPLNLILAVATATASIFLGFLPTKTIRSPFFCRETLKAAIAWGIVAITSPISVLHYPGMIAFLCLAASWHFHRDNAFTGKMWFSLASGLGISVGVMLLLAVTPRACPVDLPLTARAFLLASIYLGGAVIGLGYSCYMLSFAAPSQSGINVGLVQRHAVLLLVLVIVRAIVLMANFCLPSHASGSTSNIQFEAWLLLGLALIVLPTLAGMALRATHSRSPSKASSLFIALCGAGLFAEILARLLVL